MDMARIPHCWHRPAAAAWVGPLAWKPPCAVCVALKRQNKQTNKKMQFKAQFSASFHLFLPRTNCYSKMHTCFHTLTTYVNIHTALFYAFLILIKLEPCVYHFITYYLHSQYVLRFIMVTDINLVQSFYILFILFYFILFVSLLFLGPLPWHMEVPRLGF